MGLKLGGVQRPEGVSATQDELNIQWTHCLCTRMGHQESIILTNLLVTMTQILIMDPITPNSLILYYKIM